MKILVTGAAGFVGFHVCKELVQQGFDVIAVDCFLDSLYSAKPKLANAEKLNQHPRITFIEADLRHEIDEKILVDVDVIINEAGMPGLMKSWTDFSTYSSCNINVVERLLSAALKHNISNFVQISTSSVYGESAVGDENQPLLPVSPYGVTKLAAEELVRTFSRTYGTNFTILRYFSVYGPGQRPDMAYNKIIDSVIKGEVIPIYGDGLQSRTNTYVGDCARATVTAALGGAKGHTYNISGDEPIRLIEAIQIIEEKIGLPAKLKFFPRRDGDQMTTFGNNSLAKRDLSLSQSFSFREGISQQADWQQLKVSLSI